MDGPAALALLDEAATAIASTLGGLDDWGLAGTKPGQYRSDLAADDVAVAILSAAGVGVLSEESGRHDDDRDVTVVLDPLDGSTNASRGIPWFATSLCAVDGDGPLAALVINLVGGTRYEAVRGQGARCDGRAIRPSGATVLRQSLVALSGMPPGWLGWKQYRTLGACALDLCAVADGSLDGYVEEGVNLWDHAAGGLIARIAGARLEMHPGVGGTPMVVCGPAHGFEELLDAVRTAGFSPESGE